jgi:DNA primase
MRINFADDIKNAVTMRDICYHYGIDIDRTGNAICPFHNDRKPSMKIYDGTRGYYCFVCSDGGDIIKFVQKYFSIDFQSALKKLNDDFNLGLQIGKEVSRREQIQSGKMAYQRRKQIEDRKKEHERLKDNYFDALDNWIRLDDMKRNNEPRNPFDDFADDFVSACKNKALATYRLEEAENALYEYEHQQKGDCL